MEENKKIEHTATLADVVNMTYLSPENAEFFNCDGFISMKLTADGETKDYERVFLHRVFPYEENEKYISVLDGDGNELGMIRELDDFDGSGKDILKKELERKYFILKIKKVYDINERYGFSYWETESDEGKLSFTLQDTSRSLTRVNSDRVYINDIDGNRYEIESLKALDRKSLKKLELYL